MRLTERQKQAVKSVENALKGEKGLLLSEIADKTGLSKDWVAKALCFTTAKRNCNNYWSLSPYDEIIEPCFLWIDDEA